MNPDCANLRLSLGAYVLGTLEPADHDEVETHLAACPECRAEMADLRAVVPALANLSAADVSSPTPSEALFTRITEAVDADGSATAAGSAAQPGHQRRHAPRRWLLVAAASVVLVAGAGTAIGITEFSHSSTSATTTAHGSANGVQLQVRATDAGTGTRLELTAKGLPQHEHCRLVARAADGSTQPAGTWDASYEGAAQVVESTEVPRSQLRSLTLYGNSGKQLVVVQI